MSSTLGHSSSTNNIVDLGSLASWLGISQTPPASDRLLAEKVSWIKDCISQCDDSCTHTTLDDPLPLPTRLIYVGDRTGNEFGNPRLVITAGQDAPEYFATNRPKYAILSYCWGPPAEFLKTEKANLSDHLKELRLEDLREKAPTCCDAILVTRELDLEWLWIDALCIIQDDKEDWETESSKMASAYGGAFLTIIPLRSYSTREGFLGERASADYLDICFNSVVNPMIQGTLKVYDSSLGTSTNGTLGEIHDDLGTELRISEWQQRGWTRQESVMSFRRLFFGESGLYFECQEMTKRDNGESVDGCYDTTGDWVNEIEPGMDIVEMLKKHWYQEIEQYSRRSLTVKKDLLPAVTAIAKIFSNTIQDKYLCGLWESDLPNGLLWVISYTDGQVDHEEHMRKISSPEVYIGPSWSWTNPASNSVRVEWLTSYGKTQNPACEIIEAETNIEGINLFGCIQSAHILIRGLSRFLPGPMLHPKRLPGGTGQAWQIVEHGYFTANCRFDWYVSEYGEPRWPNDLMMLLIGVDSGAQTMNGLLLVRAGNENEWYRVGIFSELSGNIEGVEPLYNWERRTFKLV